MSPPAPSPGRVAEVQRLGVVPLRGLSSIVLAAAVAGACDHGGTGSTATGPAPGSSSPAAEGLGAGTRVYAQGELGRAQDFAMSLDGVKECPLGIGSALRLDFEKIGVEVDLEATTDRQIPASVFYATLTDPAGEHHPATLAGCEPVLSAVVLDRGEKAHGVITFAIPRLARKLELRYAPPVVGQPAEELRFTVAR